MRQDTSVSGTAQTTDAGARVALRVAHFDLVTTMLGLATDEARAALIGLTTRQISRARNGEPVGERFIAGTLEALRRHHDTFTAAGVPITFESLFETVASVPGSQR